MLYIGASRGEMSKSTHCDSVWHHACHIWKFYRFHWHHPYPISKQSLKRHCTQLWRVTNGCSVSRMVCPTTDQAVWYVAFRPLMTHETHASIANLKIYWTLAFVFGICLCKAWCIALLSIHDWAPQANDAAGTRVQNPCFIILGFLRQRKYTWTLILDFQCTR